MEADRRPDLQTRRERRRTRSTEAARAEGSRPEPTAPRHRLYMYSAVHACSAREPTAARPIVYRVSMPDPASHEYEVEMLVPALPTARGGDRLPGLGAGELHGARLRPPPDRPRRHRRRRPRASAGARGPGRQAALADRQTAGGRFASATGSSPSRRRCARRSSTTATPTGTAPACSSSSTASSARRCQVTVALPDRALARRHRAAGRRAGVASPTRPPTSTSSVTRRSRSGRTRSTPSPSGGRGSSWRSTAAPTPIRRASSTSSAAW